MGYSQLATIKIWSPNGHGTRTHVVDSVSIHCICDNVSAQTLGEFYADPKYKRCSNYGIGSDGVIGVYAEEDTISDCTSNRNVDARSISIQVASTDNKQPYNISGLAYESLVNLLVDICRRNTSIAKLKWKADKDYAIKAANGGVVLSQNIFIHSWFNSSKPDPGLWLYEHMGELADDVNTRIDSNIIPMASTTYPTINYDKFTPYIARLSRNSTDVPYELFSSNKVIGCLVEGGYLYDSSAPGRKPVDKFENPILKNQIENLKKEDIPYGLYTYCRARTEPEAKSEMYYFSFPVRRYSPKLGVWLSLELSGSKSENDILMNRYQYELNRLGFSGKMGIMCKESMLEKIDWEKYQESFYLYLYKPITKESQLDALLDPEFFDVKLS